MTSSGVVADDFYVDDDDILSNTSSDDYADMSNPFHMSRKDVEHPLTVSDSFDTLTGSKDSGSIKNDVTPKKKKKRIPIKDILSRIESVRKPELKVWHVALLSSLVTVLVLVGSQKYLQLFDGILNQRDNVSIAHNSSNKDLIYSDINFLNNDEPMSPSWRPSGQYYVDFDNHIAYPLPSKDLLGWRKLKTDSAIFWYTLKARYRNFLASDAMATFQSRCHGLASLVKRKADWVQTNSVLAKRLVLERCKSALILFRADAAKKWLKLQNDYLVLKADVKKVCTVNSAKLKRVTELRARSLYNATSKVLKGKLKSARSGFLHMRSYFMRESVPQVQALSDGLIKSFKRWSKLSDKNARVFFSRFHRKFHKQRSSFVVDRLSNNLRACEQIAKKRFKCWQFSRFKISRG